MLEFLTKHTFLRELVASTSLGLGVYAICALVIIAAELRQHRNMSVYRSRNALNDLAYSVFYKCSIYNILVLPIFSFLSPRVQFMRSGVHVPLPLIVSLIVYWIIFDFLNYWTHRLQHSVRFLWAFHSVHHTQTRLTFLTANRIHVFEQLFMGLLTMVPALLLGIPQGLWLPLLFLQIFSETFQHARLNWTFGPLYRFIISPVFHAIHHSTDEREYNGNYGRVLSIWDVIFGTFVQPESSIRHYGVEGMDVPERLMAQFVHPFRYLLSRRVRALSPAVEEVSSILSS